jgi:hypothetical protein
MVAVVLWQYGSIHDWAVATGWQRSVRLVMLISLGAAIYGVTLFAGGLRIHHLHKGAS